MSAFEKLEGSNIVYTKKGYYKESAMYVFDGDVFIKEGSSYLRVYKDHAGPSFFALHRVHIMQGRLNYDKLGRMTYVR